jgi:hypothetical protein
MTSVMRFTVLREKAPRLIFAWKTVRNCCIHNFWKVRSDFDRKRVRLVGLNLQDDDITLPVSDVTRCADVAYEFVHGVFDRLAGKAGLV